MSERRFIKRTKGTASPSALIFFDTETLPHPWEGKHGGALHKLRLGVATYVRLEDGRETRRDKIVFYDTKTFWDWVDRKTHPRMVTWLFAHNLGFDLTVAKVWEEISNGRYSLSGSFELKPEDGDGRERTVKHGPLCVMDDPPTAISLMKADKTKLLCVDSLNYWRMSLASMGEKMGIAKLEMPDFDAPDEDWVVYCTRDVEVLERSVLALIEWVKRNDYGDFRISAPALAMGAWRHKFYQWCIELHDDMRVKELERAGYYGGHLELFFCGKPKGMVYALDVASQYPYVMQAYKYPFRLRSTSYAIGRREDYTSYIDGSCVAHVYIDDNDNDYSVRTDQGIIHPVGRYWTTLCGPELGRALKNGSVKRCDAFASYDLADIFSQFVHHFWNGRREYEKQDNAMDATLCKLMMNSLYGKFGQLNSQWEQITGVTPTVEWGGFVKASATRNTVQEYRVLGDRIERKVEPTEHHKAMPIIAAFVTAYGREYMRELRMIAGRENVFYLVTDALYVNEEGYQRLNAAGYVVERTLGKLSIQEKDTNANFKALHHLELGKTVKRGSVKPRAILQDDGSYLEDHFQGLKSVLSAKPIDGIVVRKQRKRVDPKYTRGVITESGWITPIVLEQPIQQPVKLGKLLR